MVRLLISSTILWFTNGCPSCPNFPPCTMNLKVVEDSKACTMKALKCKASAPLASGGPLVLAHAHGLEIMRYITCPSDKRTCTSHATKLKRRVSGFCVARWCWCRRMCMAWRSCAISHVPQTSARARHMPPS